MTPQDAIFTLYRLSQLGALDSTIFLRAPSGGIAGEYKSVTDVPDEAIDPRTGAAFSPRVWDLEVYWYVPRQGEDGNAEDRR